MQYELNRAPIPHPGFHELKFHHSHAKEQGVKLEPTLHGRTPEALKNQSKKIVYQVEWLK